MVIAIIAVLASLLLPALSRAKERAHLAQCMSNFKQLQLAWQMYADDNQDEPMWPPALDWADLVAVGDKPPAWTEGQMSYAPNNYDNFRTDYLLDPKWSAMAPYIQNTTVYKCPSDHSTALWNGIPRLRARSYSYNLDWGLTIPGNEGALSGHRKAYRTRNTSKAITFIEQHEDGLSDAYFQLPYFLPSLGRLICDIPAARHNGACAIAFADGHVESKRWIDPRTRLPVLGKQQAFPASTFQNNPDFTWLADRRVKF